MAHACSYQIIASVFTLVLANLDSPQSYVNVFQINDIMPVFLTLSVISVLCLLFLKVREGGGG